MRRAFVDLQCRARDEFGRAHRSGFDRYDLVIVAVDNQSRNVERLEVARLVCLGEGLDAVENIFRPPGIAAFPAMTPDGSTLVPSLVRSQASP